MTVNTNLFTWFIFIPALHKIKMMDAGTLEGLCFFLQKKTLSSDPTLWTWTEKTKKRH